MAKKIVRGITDVKTINNQDFDTNNVNDLLSDGQYNYIHRKKGENEEYHNLTDNIKTLSSDNTDLLTVTNNNKTTNTATLHPKHDAQKEQVLETTDNTILITHGENGTEERTNVDVNFEKVQAKLSAGDGLAIENNQINIKPKALRDLPNKNGLYYGDVTGDGVPYCSISLNSDNNKYFQVAFRESVYNSGKIVVKYRFMVNNVPNPWQEMLVDDEIIRGLLAQKQDTLTAGTGITIQGQTIDTNPQKVLEHENLLTIDGISKVTTGNTTTIGLKIIDNYSGDLNELTETCLVRPTNNVVNSPGAGARGILTVVKIGDTVSQKYHSLDNMVITRVGDYFEGEWGWSPWTRIGGADPT